jgi:hypothetical protein
MKLSALIFLLVLAMSIVLGTSANAVPAGQRCGGVVGVTCDKGLWCEPPDGKCGSTAGVCVRIPRLCIARKKSKSFKPVCGCNSKTYSSDCFRRAYKVGKFHDGKCEPASTVHAGR